MKRTAKRMIVAATLAAVSFQSVPVASACGGSRGRGSRIARPSGSYPHPASIYRQPSRSYTPSYTQSYGQPAYNQHVYNQSRVVAPRPVAPTTVAAVQPRSRAQVAAQTSVAPQSVTIQSSATAPRTTRQSTSQQPASPAVANQRVSRQQVATQPATKTATSATSATSADAEVSALAALASIASQTAAKPEKKVQQVETKAPETQPAVPQFTPASSTAAEPTGSFQANLPSNVTIQLSLDSSGTFSWVVRNNGKTTTFSGQYRIADGRLTLVRSNDLQQMAGKLTTGQNGFTFKLDGAGNGGLDFKKV